ncbi:MAG: YIP1 family protein [Longimicrobiales bacterium]
MNSIAPRSMTDRMIGAAKLDISVYEEVEADTTATGQAAGVVAIVALCSALGGVGGGASGAFSGLIAALVGWAIWAGVTYLIGDKLLGGTATWGELLRTLGFAQAPGVLFVLGGIPLLGAIVGFAVGLWILVTGVVAIRQALDFGTGRAIATALLGFIPYALLAVLLRVN